MGAAEVGPDGVMELKVEQEEEGEVYGRWESTREDITCPAHRQDVYERSLVAVGQSGVAGGGEGLFAREEIPANTVCSYYNGVRMKPGEQSAEEDSGYSIFLDWGTSREERLEKSEHLDLPRKASEV